MLVGKWTSSPERRPRAPCRLQCELLVLDRTSQSWVERGEGLRGPKGMASVDNGRLQSKLVMQTQGSLRLILSAKLWAQTQINKASENIVHITATNTEDQA